jgi:hypothetical protein
LRQNWVFIGEFRKRLFILKAPSCVNFIHDSPLSLTKLPCLALLKKNSESKFKIELRLKCFVIIELKTHPITHQDIGQLDMYVRMYDDLKKPQEDNPTIGILLCTETDKTIVKYSVLAESKQLFTAKYMDYLPSEKELEDEIERQKLILKLNQQ